MPVEHYENFPVASILLPRHLRQAVETIYVFARRADDIADEGDALPEARLADLAAYRAQLQAIADGRTPDEPMFARLAVAIDAHQLPLQPLFDLLDAFSQDVVKTRYADFPELLAYCRRSANPVGRLMLALYGVKGPQALAWSDQICSALQLINFWQDVAIDWQKNRVYLPQDDLARFGIVEADIASGRAVENWWPLMQFEIARARAMLWAGAPLLSILPGRIGFELRLVVLGGNAILNKLQRCRADVFQSRPVLGKADWVILFMKAVIMSPKVIFMRKKSLAKAVCEI